MASRSKGKKPTPKVKEEMQSKWNQLVKFWNSNNCKWYTVLNYARNKLSNKGAPLE